MNCSKCGILMIKISDIVVNVEYVNHVIESETQVLLQCPKCKTIKVW